MASYEEGNNKNELPLHSQELCLDLLNAVNDSQFFDIFEKAAGSETSLSGAQFETPTMPEQLMPYLGRANGVYTLDINARFIKKAGGAIDGLQLAIQSTDATSPIFLRRNDKGTLMTVDGITTIESGRVFNDALVSALVGTRPAIDVDRHIGELLCYLESRAPITERAIDFFVAEGNREINLRLVESETKTDSIHAIEITDLVRLEQSDAKTGLRLTITEGGISEGITVHNAFILKTPETFEEWQAVFAALNPENNAQIPIIPNEKQTQRLRCAVEDVFEHALQARF